MATLQIGDLVRILPAYSMDTHKQDRVDDYTGQEGVIRQIFPAEHGARETILVECARLEIFINRSRLELVATAATIRSSKVAARVADLRKEFSI